MAALALLLGVPVCCARAEPPAPAPEGAVRLAAGGRRTYATTSHTCAVVDEALQCWGAADLGQTGDGSLASRRPLPVRVGGLARVQAVAAGGSHTCVRSEGRVLCFGDNGQGQGGVARPFLLLEPTPVPGLPGDATALGAGREHSCAVAEGQVWCWGRNEAGEAGAEPRPDCREPFRVRRCSVAPTPVPGIEGRVSALALGARHSCALAEGAVYCWGANDRGQLGDAERSGGARASRVPGLSGASALASGRDHSCAIVGGRLFCWGGGAAAPAPVAGLDGGLRLVAAGGDRTCAAAGPRAWCFAQGSAPQAVGGLDAPLLALAVSADHACALLADGSEVRCWGENDSGQLGDGAAPRGHGRAAPVADWDRGGLRDAQGDGRITVVCLGDSNTAPAPGAWPSWCERLAPLLPSGFRVVNRGLGGATATRRASLISADRPLAHALENDAPDVAVLAYGTNDVLAEVEVSEIVAETQGLARRLLAAGALPLVALVPPVREGDAEANRAIAALNTALREAFPAERIVDFASGFGEAQLVDRVHLDDEAQERRARIAASVLVALLGEGGP